MVELDLVNHEQSGNDDKKVQKESTTSTNLKQNLEQEGREKAAIDLELVAQLREMLKNEVTSQDAQNGANMLNENMSQMHYEEIMDPQSTYVCWRYIKHCHCHLEEALELTKKALQWHKKQVDDILVDNSFVKEFWHSSAFSFVGQDKKGNDILYIRGKDYRKADAIFKETVLRFCTARIFEWEKAHRYDLRQVTTVIDVTGTGYRHIDMAFSSWIMSILDFIPARLEVIYVVGIPTIVRPIIRMIISWLPDRYRTILQCGSFEDLVLKNIELSELPVEVGGTLDVRRYRMAPKEAPWLIDSEIYNTDEMRKAFFYSLCYNLSEERREELCKMQVEYDT